MTLPGATDIETLSEEGLPRRSRPSAYAASVKGRTSRQLLRGGAAIAVAMAVMNVTTYGFTILAARLLGPEEYGALAAVMGVLLVVNVLSLGLQATGARRVSAAPQDLVEIEREVMRTSYLSAVALGLLLLVATPVVTDTLNLDSWLAAALIAVTVVPLSVMGGQAGILQGERRWGALAGIYLAVGLGRLGFGAIALVLEPHTLGAMMGVAAGAFLPVLVGALALRHPGRRRALSALPAPGGGTAQAVPPRRWAPGGVLRETLHNSHALLAFFALSNTDVIVARSTLDARQAGLYAGGLILAKAVLFLPQFVVVIAFPSMSRQGSGRRMHLLSLGMVLTIGVVTVLGVATLSSLALVFIGGPEYGDLQGRLWVFAALGTLLAVLQLMIYDVVARQHQRMVFVVWAGMALLLAASPFVESVTALLSIVVTIDALLFAVLLLASLRTATPETPPVVARTPVP
jgi:O-antigen/teichoic acid export membrane protein